MGPAYCHALISSLNGYSPEVCSAAYNRALSNPPQKQCRRESTQNSAERTLQGTVGDVFSSLSCPAEEADVGRQYVIMFLSCGRARRVASHNVREAKMRFEGRTAIITGSGSGLGRYSLTTDRGRDKRSRRRGYGWCGPGSIGASGHTGQQCSEGDGH